MSSRWIVPPVVGIAEPALTPEAFAEGIGAIEANNGCVRLYLVTEQIPLTGDVRAMRPVVQRVVMPLSCLPTIVAQLALCLSAGSDHMPPLGGGTFPRLVT